MLNETSCWFVEGFVNLYVHHFLVPLFIFILVSPDFPTLGHIFTFLDLHGSHLFPHFLGRESGWGADGPPSPRRGLELIDLTILLNDNEDDHPPEQIAGAAAAIMFKWKDNYIKKRSSSLVYPGNFIKHCVGWKGVNILALGIVSVVHANNRLG